MGRFLKHYKIGMSERLFDLEERTAKFGEAVLEFAFSLSKNSVTSPLINQIVRSATSVGANYLEAEEASSKKDFRHKIGICKKEARETMHWLRMIAKSYPTVQETCRKLWKEAHEFTLIFGSILTRKR